METKFVILTPEFNDSLAVSVAIVKQTVIDGTIYHSTPWRKAYVKGETLGDTLPTIWGDLSWSDFPAERDYILAKWAELEA